jgi:hypothetical protein
LVSEARAAENDDNKSYPIAVRMTVATNRMNRKRRRNSNTELMMSSSTVLQIASNFGKKIHNPSF